MQSKCKAMQSNFTRLVFVLILSNCLIINKAVVSFRYAVFTKQLHRQDFFCVQMESFVGFSLYFCGD